jgi:DNA polymerase-3 subunit gamma/tau
MGYQVTARKWRPQTFDDIVEQQHVTRTLRNAIRLERVAHAYLFAGTRGVGKTTTARVLAKALNCERGPTVDPCNQCQSCHEITQGISLDIVEIDGASNRGIDEIRDLRERLRYLPSRGRYKVYIIDEVHMLTKEAFNALLKTLEEPPAHVVFIFATTELDKIPYTILSRCQRFEFKRVSLTGIVEQLDRIVHAEGISISRASLMRIAKAAEGSVRDAQSLFDQVVAFCGLEVRDADVSQLLGVVAGEQLAHCLTALCQQDAATALHLVSTWQQEGHETASIVRALLEGLRHVMVLKTAHNPEDLIPLSEADLAALRTVAEQVNIEEIYGHFHVLSAAESLLRSASNQFIVLEMTLVRMACIGRVQSLQAILDRLQGSREALRPAAEASGTGTSPSGMTASPPPEGAAPAEASSPLAAPPAAPAQEGTGSGGEDFWPTLLAWVDTRRPSIAACLQTGRIVSRTDEALVIGFPARERFSCSTVQEPENLTLIRQAVQAVTSRPLRVTITLLDEEPERANGSGDPQTPAPAVQSSQEALQQQKRESIQAVLDIFDGRIIM